MQITCSWNSEIMCLSKIAKIAFSQNLRSNYLKNPLLSVQSSRSVMSNSLQPHGLNARPPCPSPTPEVYSNSCPLSQWYHPNISSSVVSFSSRLQSFPASGSFQMSVLRIRWPKYWSFNFSISPSSEYSRLISFRMDWLDLLAVQGTLKSLLQHHSSKASDQIRSDQSLSRVRLFAIPWIAACQASLSITNSRNSLRLTSIESVMPSSHLILSSPSPPAPNPSQHQSLFQWVNSSHEVAKVLEFQL